MHIWKIKGDPEGVDLMQEAHNSKNVLFTVENIIWLSDGSTVWTLAYLQFEVEHRQKHRASIINNGCQSPLVGSGGKGEYICKTMIGYTLTKILLGWLVHLQEGGLVSAGTPDDGKQL